jgi:hypothetical protein
MFINGTGDVDDGEAEIHDREIAISAQRTISKKQAVSLLGREGAELTR